MVIRMILNWINNYYTLPRQNGIYNEVKNPKKSKFFFDVITKYDLPNCQDLLKSINFCSQKICSLKIQICSSTLKFANNAEYRTETVTVQKVRDLNRNSASSS